VTAAPEPPAPEPARPSEPEPKRNEPKEGGWLLDEEKKNEEAEEGPGILGRTVGAILGTGAEEGEEGDERTDLNRANFEELREIGFSVTQATRVITYRDRAGGFDSLDALDDVPGMPKEFLDVVKPKLRIGQRPE
jgi:DNA uptake protein ComE-like DNA-binding protein